MDEKKHDYPVGYGKPPVESRFRKGKSGNPGGRPRRTKSLLSLLGEALSQRSGLPKEDGTWMTKGEFIVGGLVEGAAGTDPKAKRLLFDVLVKLHRADDYRSLPEIILDDYDGNARAEFDAETERWGERLPEIEAQNRAPLEEAKAPAPEDDAETRGKVLAPAAALPDD